MHSSTNYGFTFNDHHSSDFGLRVLNSKSMTLPNKTKVTVQLPYSDGVVDLSNVYGNNNFGERTITFPCRLPVGYNNREQLYSILTKITNWLMSPAGKIRLGDDVMSDFYYLAEVEHGPQIQEFSVYTNITIVFQCYPYRFHRANNEDLWDPFRFDWDIAQNTKFDVKGTQNILLISGSNTTVPLNIDASAGFQLIINNQAFPIPKGITNNYDIVIKPGENNITIKGTGIISFDWVEEVI